jgi:hypothetical protein
MKTSMIIAVLEGMRFDLEKQIDKSRNALCELEALEGALEIVVNTDR